MPHHGGKLGKTGKGRINRDALAEPGGERVLQLLGTGIV
jgi:hypothetical protein